MKMISAAALFGAVLTATPASAATLLQYQFFGNAGDEVSEAAINAATGLSGLAFTRGAGLTATGGANSLNSNGFDSPGATDFYSFGLNVLAGYSATVDQLVFGTQASGTGPGAIDLLASVDGGGFAVVASFAQAASATSRTINLATAITARSNVTFRLTPGSNVNANGTGTIGAAGTFRVTNPVAGNGANPFSINGTVVQAVAAVPETGTWAMMIVGFGAAGAAMRRRRTATRVTFAA